MINFFKKIFTQETQTNEDYWTEYYIEGRKKLISKIEASHKILNSELADKLTINK